MVFVGAVALLYVYTPAPVPQGFREALGAEAGIHFNQVWDAVNVRYWKIL